MRSAPPSLDRQAVLEWYRRNRERSRAFFDLLADEAYYSQPIALRHPIVFYEGHLPAFSFNTLAKRALGRPSIDGALETLFARGIDPEEPAGGSGKRTTQNVERETGNAEGPTENARRWPAREEVRQFGVEADRQVLDALADGDVDQPGHPLLDRAEAVFAILEHEAMHQETLLYIWHRLPFQQKRRPAAYTPRTAGPVPAAEWVEIPAGTATLGVDRESVVFGWDNEFPACRADVAGFAIERHDVTNARFLEFVDEGGYADPRWWRPEDWRWIQAEGIAHPLFWEREGAHWCWRGMFDLIPLPPAWPVYVSHAEAAAFARWRGARLPTEAEFQRAAFGAPGAPAPGGDSEVRRHPWGDAAPAGQHGVFDFSSWDPQPAGSHPEGASAWGVEDLVGNGWKWTDTPFAPFPGFRAMASYPCMLGDY